MIKIIRKSIFFICLQVILNGLYSQSLPYSNEYISNKVMLSPAFTGIYNDINSSITYKTNWLGFQGAPEYIRGSIDMPMPYNSAFGVSLMNHKVGIFSDFNGNIDYSFVTPLKQDHNLHFGLRIQFLRSSLNYNKIKPTDLNDPFIQYSTQVESINKFNSSFGVGYNWENLYAGINISNLFKKDLEYGNVKYPTYRKFELFSSYLYEIDRNWQLEGFAFISKIKDSKFAYEITAIGKYDKDFWFGLTWRRPVNIGLNIGTFFTENIYFNYTASITGEPGFANTLGSHELSMGYRMKSSNWFLNSKKKSDTLLEKLIALINSLFRR
ncbi:MAG: PorP/SprF family type IX secretion system membrane protein [Bacteroidales bacterium]|nr:PorP/SprF family type IX secretion system membrane protein [Bacteroidales bacterium]